ncbi:Lrp/AsnC family transcriptional regulator [Rhodococcus sp. NPDC060176]|uniref:Lrp/AsnC family transcriptional regulator n=1 Tax=Rhodococcus sp. NPDC060176 TaxID=3347062 RepID=UPI003654F4A6
MNFVTLDDLDRRIVGALQIDGRATWRHIADVLGESFSTVTRRGNELLASKTVRISTLVTSQPTHLLYIDCDPSVNEAVARLIAASPSTIFVYAMGGTPSLVAEIAMNLGDLDVFVHNEIATISGIRSAAVAPILRYFRTVAHWRPSILTPQQVNVLDQRHAADEEAVEPLDVSSLDCEDQAIVAALAADGRASVKSIAADAGLSETTARRRIDSLFAKGVVHNRAVVEPSVLGLPIEAILWITVNPGDVVGVGHALATAPGVRYAAFTMGTSQLVVDVTMQSLDELSGFLTASSWVHSVQTVRAEILVRAYKRSLLPTHFTT